MSGSTAPVLFVTANVGSIFEDPSVMLKIWSEEFLATVSRLNPKMVALHCQEVGGKNYERSMKHVSDFVKLLMESEELRLFDKVRIFLDEDFSSAENFTALGSFYFIHESISDIMIWDFKELEYIPVEGKEMQSGNIEDISTKEKSKFPQNFFPECKWSRKGYLRTRWSLNGTVFDLINIHLFHDASNFIAMESYPSIYCQNRRQALDHILKLFHSDGAKPFFLFGDFNFRTDTKGVIEKLTEGLIEERLQGNNKIEYKDESSQVVLTVGKKEFKHIKHQIAFTEDDGLWMLPMDRELEAFNQRLFEFPINFPPSYPFEEQTKDAERYMPTRCPAWCDRVVFSENAQKLVHNYPDANDVEYGLMGRNTCMGDHKPVYLRMSLINDAGIVTCSCESNPKSSWLSCYAGPSFPPPSLSPYPDIRFLCPIQPHDEPYTPESIPTPLPSPGRDQRYTLFDPQALEARLKRYGSENSVTDTFIIVDPLRINDNSNSDPSSSDCLKVNHLKPSISNNDETLRFNQNGKWSPEKNKQADNGCCYCVVS